MNTETIYSEYIEFRSSEVLESKREVDYYEYSIKHGKIYSKITNRPVEESITSRSEVELAELVGFKQIQLWAVYSEGGSCVWVSPPARSDLSAKVVISEIGFDTKIGKKLINRNICFDWDEQLFLHFADYCHRNDIAKGEDLRSRPIFLTQDEEYKLYELLEQLEPLQVEQVRTGDDIRNKEKLKNDLASNKAVAMGNNAPSCPGAAFAVFSGEKRWCEKCPVCGFVIKDFIGRGYVCKGCHNVKKC